MSSKETNDLFLYGASGHGKVVLEIAEILNLPIGGFIDQNPNLRSIYGYPVLRELPEYGNTFISIGNNLIRKNLAEKISEKRYIRLIHPECNISKRCEIGVGSVIMAGATLNTGSQIGSHCIINTNASIDHECTIRDFVHISPNVALAGDVSVGEGTHIGIGACVIQGVRIGKWVTIGAGAVIIRDVPDYAVVVGNPGKVIKYNK